MPEQPERPERSEVLDYPFESSPGLSVHATYARLREEPLTRVRLAYGEQAWLATRHADVKTVLSSPYFSVAAGVGRDQPRTRPTPRPGGGLIASDPPDHSRLRAVLSRRFTARQVEGLRTRAREIADELLEAMTATGSPADLASGLAFPLPMILLCELVGVPYEERGHVRHWADAVLSNDMPTEELSRQGAAFFARMNGWMRLRRKEPGDDVLTVLVRACDEDGRISEQEVLIMLGELLIAGFVSTTNQILNVYSHLLTHPDTLDRLRKDPGLIPNAVEELMRYVPLLNGLMLPRYAIEDVELGGVRIRAGEPVVFSLEAANRDPQVFPDAESLVLDRPGANPHLSFGHGLHFCIGAHLARLELQVALEAVLHRIPGLRLAVPREQLAWRPELMLNGLRELPVAW